MKKRLLSILLAAIMCLTMVPVTALAAEPGHPANGHGDWTNWGDVESEWTELPTEAGSYYLTHDVTLTDMWTVPAGTVNLCLNGYVIKQTKDNTRVIEVPSGAMLNLYDCGATKHDGYIDSTTKLWTADAEDIHSGQADEYDIIGGLITGGNITNGNGGGGVYVARGSLNMYGGAICGNKADNEEDLSAGGVSVVEGSFTMYGGEISGNKADIAGGVETVDKPFIMYGGKISRNTALMGGGGGVGAVGDTFTMTGGEISGNTAMVGGGVMLGDEAHFDLINGTISGNTAMLGGGIASDDSSIKMTGGEISGNTAGMYFGGVYLSAPEEDEVGFTVGKNAVISNNADSTGASNLAIPQGMQITLATDSDMPISGMQIGVTLFDGEKLNESGEFVTLSGQFTDTSAESDMKYFFSDNPAYYVNFVDDEPDYLELKAPESGNYAINVIPSANGTVTASAKEAAKDAEITLTVTPDSGYQLKTLTVTDADDGSVLMADNKFTMPDKGVTVIAEFEEAEEDDNGSALLHLLRAALVTKLTVCHLLRGVTNSAARIAKIAAFNATLPVIIARWFWHF